MTELINIQFNMFAIATFLGVLMGFSYDVLRCIRRIIVHNLLFISLEDFIYWFAWTIIVLNSVAEYNYGQLRIYIFVTMLLGFCVYKTTIGWVLMRFFNYMWCSIEKCLHNANKFLKKNRNNSKI